MNPQVSILIPAHNAEEWIADSIQSAIGQTWPNKEIIVVDDGSTDCTAEVAGKFTSKQVVLVSTQNCGAAAARNHALQLSQGDYIQWLDADDVLAPDKIERQLAALRKTDTERTLLSSAWASFNYRTNHARFAPTPLWHDLSPIEWLVKRMSERLYMQTATWLTSRELTQAAGPWDTRLFSDDDVEYFCRVLRVSKEVRFVPDAKVFYRNSPSTRLSYMGTSQQKRNALLLSLKLQVQYIRSLEDSERVREASLKYLQNFLDDFYPERPDIVAELQVLAAELGGTLKLTGLRPKYAWIKPVFGVAVAKWAQRTLPVMKSSAVRCWDRAMYKLENRGDAGNRAPHSISAT